MQVEERPMILMSARELSEYKDAKKQKARDMKNALLERLEKHNRTIEWFAEHCDRNPERCRKTLEGDHALTQKFLIDFNRLIGK